MKKATIVLLSFFSILNANNFDENNSIKSIKNSFKEELNNTVNIINKDINSSKDKNLQFSNKNKQIVENFNYSAKTIMKSHLSRKVDTTKKKIFDNNSSATNKKIIEKISKMERKLKNIELTVKQNTKLIQNKCNNILLKQVSVKLIDDIHNIKDKISAINSNISDLKMSIPKPFQIKPKCAPHKELDLKKSIKVLKGSFKKFKKEHTFTAKKDLKVYPLPELGVKPFDDINITKGTKFKADMFTYAGWIHAKEKGWVKGYLLKPVFLQIKKGNKKHSASPVFDVVSCKTK